MKPALRISLFGKFSVHLGDEVLLDHAPHKAQELLAYLALHRAKAHPRDTLADLLWHDLDTPNARKYLRQALWQLHTGLLVMGRTRLAQVLRVEADWLELKLDSRAELDVACFEQAFGSVNGTIGEDLQAEAVRRLAESVRLYTGDLVEGWTVDWCHYDRERYRRMYLSMLDRLTDHFESRHEYDAAIAYATLSLGIDPSRERSHRSLMRALAMSGDRCGAMRQYTRCVGALRDELGADPEPETVVLERMIRAGEVVGAVRERFAGASVAQAGKTQGDLAVVSGSGRSGSSLRARSIP